MADMRAGQPSCEIMIGIRTWRPDGKGYQICGGTRGPGLGLRGRCSCLAPWQWFLQRQGFFPLSLHATLLGRRADIAIILPSPSTPTSVDQTLHSSQRAHSNLHHGETRQHWHSSLCCHRVTDPHKDTVHQHAAANEIFDPRSFLFGYDSGVMTDVIASQHFLDFFDTTETSPIIGAINSTFNGGAVFGALFGGVIMDKYGRKLTITIGATIGAIGGILQGAAYQYVITILRRRSGTIL